MRISYLPVALLLTAFTITSCEEDHALVDQVEITTPEPRFIELPAGTKGTLTPKNADGVAYALHMGEYITADGSD